MNKFYFIFRWIYFCIRVYLNSLGKTTLPIIFSQANKIFENAKMGTAIESH